MSTTDDDEEDDDGARVENVSSTWRKQTNSADDKPKANLCNLTQQAARQYPRMVDTPHVERRRAVRTHTDRNNSHVHVDADDDR